MLSCTKEQLRVALRSAVKDGLHGTGVRTKIVNVPVAKSADGSFRFVISTGDVDRDNDTIAQDGWDLANFKRNPVVLFGHRTDILPVGKATQIGVQGNKLVASVEFAKHQHAQDVRHLVEDGILNATSVGFRPIESTYNHDRGGFDFKRCELHEFSIVPVPANPGALRVRSMSGDVDSAVLRQLIRGFVKAELRG